MKWLAILLAGVPILDRFLVALNQQAFTQRLADVVVTLIITYLIFCRKFVVGKHNLGIVTIIAVFAFMFFLRDTTILSFRQSVAILLMGLYFLAIVEVARLGEVYHLAKAIVLICAFNSILTILIGFFPEPLDFLISERTLTGRSIAGFKMPFVRNAGLFNHYGYAATYMAASVLMSVLLVRAGKLSTLAFYSFLILILLTVVVMQSRSSLLSVGLLVVATISLRLNISLKQLSLIALIVLSIFFNEILILWETLISIKESTFQGRLDQIDIGLNIFLSDPVFGGGYSAYFEYSNGHVLHNMLINIISSVGLLGLLVFILINLWSVSGARMSGLFSYAVVTFSAIHLILSATSGLSFYSLWMFFAMVYSMRYLHVNCIAGPSR